MGLGQEGSLRGVKVPTLRRRNNNTDTNTHARAHGGYVSRWLGFPGWIHGASSAGALWRCPADTGSFERAARLSAGGERRGRRRARRSPGVIKASSTTVATVAPRALPRRSPETDASSSAMDGGARCFPKREWGGEVAPSQKSWPPGADL